MEKVAELVNQIKEQCSDIISIYVHTSPIEVHLPSRIYHKTFSTSCGNEWPHTTYPIELYNIINGIKFFTLETSDGWYPDAAN